MLERERAAANAFLGGYAPEEILAWAANRFGSGLVMSTSFGRNSAVLLHFVHAAQLQIPIIFLDMDVPEENRAYRHTLERRFDFSARTYAPRGAHEGKLELMARALGELGASAVLHGARASQNAHRATLSPLMPREDGCVRIYPVLALDDREVARRFAAYSLPVHPAGLPSGIRLECGLHL